MRKVKLYIAISLDGKIADENGNVDWLDKIPNPENESYEYHDLIESIDTTIMGNSTYQQVLSFPTPFPYAEMENYVLTKDTSLEKDEHVTYVSSNIKEKISDLKQKEGKDIWLIGGAEANTLIHNMGLIDEYMVFVMPIILGNGIPLFSKNHIKQDLKLINCKTYKSGVILLHYIKS
ncbi:MAG: dihydrofolate reductase [Cyclobacteriaceae bacterium]